MIDEKCFPPETLEQIRRSNLYLHLKDKYPGIDPNHIYNYTMGGRGEQAMLDAYYPPLSLVKND